MLQANQGRGREVLSTQVPGRLHVMYAAAHRDQAPRPVSKFDMVLEVIELEMH